MDVIKTACDRFSFQYEYLKEYFFYSKSMYPDIQNLEEFGIDKNLDVRLKTTKQEYIKSVQDQINICCNMIPANLCFENYCYLNNLSPYDFKKEKQNYKAKIYH